MIHTCIRTQTPRHVELSLVENMFSTVIRIIHIDGNQHARQKSYGTKDVVEEAFANVNVFGVAPSHIKYCVEPFRIYLKHFVFISKPTATG
jgi:hypothetical protein